MQWSSEGIQVGNVGSVAGIVGSWMGATHNYGIFQPLTCFTLRNQLMDLLPFTGDPIGEYSQFSLVSSHVIM